MAEGFFAGFAKRMGENIRGEAERARKEDEQTKQFQLDRLIEISQRPDLRDEEKAPLLSQIIELAGAKAGKGTKKKPGFTDMLGSVLSIFDKPKVSQTGAQPIARPSEADELASMAGIGGGGNVRPREVSPYMTTPPIAGGEIPGLPQRQGPFYSADEMVKRRLSALEPELKLKQQYDRRNLEDANWEKAGEETVLPSGERVQRYQNRLTGATRDIPLPLGQTKTEFQERTRAAARVQARLQGSQANRKIEELAGQLAAAANPDNPRAAKDPAIVEQFWDDAATELLRKRQLDSDAVQSAMDLRTDQRASLRANMPRTGEPTAASNRKFTQYSKEISEIENKIKTLTTKGGVQAAIAAGVRRPSDTDEADMDRFIRDRDALLKQLNDRLQELGKLRRGESVEESVPAREGSTTVPKRGGGLGQRTSNPQLPGDIFERPVGSGKWFKVDRVTDDGKLEVSPTKPPRR